MSLNAMFPVYVKYIYELAKAKRGLMVIFKIFIIGISVFEYCETFHWFCTSTSENKCYNILLKSLSGMLAIPKCDIIYYVIYVIWLQYVRKAISPLFAWASSYVIYVVIAMMSCYIQMICYGLFGHCSTCVQCNEMLSLYSVSLVSCVLHQELISTLHNISLFMYILQYNSII